MKAWFDGDGVLKPERDPEFSKIVKAIKPLVKPLIGKASWRDLYELFKDAGISAVGELRCDQVNRQGR